MRKTKQFFSTILVVAMLLAMIPSAAFAGGNDYQTELLVEKTGEDAVDVKWMLQTSNGAQIKTTAGLLFKYDNTVYDLVDNDGNVVTTKTMSDNLFDTVVNEKDEQNITTVGPFWNTSGIYSEAKGNTTFVLFALMTNKATAKEFTEKSQLMVVHLKLKSGLVSDKLPGGSIALADASEATSCGQSAILAYIDGNDTPLTYNGKSGDTLTAAPTITTGAGVEFAKPALGGSVSISGTAVIGSSLSVNKSLDYNGAAEGTLGYQWKANGIEVGTEATYTVKADDFGKTITVTVTNSNNSGSVTSAPTAAVVKKDYAGSPATAATVDKTATTVTVKNVVAGQEYAITAGSDEPDSGWNTTGIFTELDVNTNYTVYTRVAATADTEASASETTSVTTDKLTQTITVPTGTVTVTYGSKLDLKTVCSSNASGSTLTFTLDGTVPTGSTFTAGTGVIDATGATVDGTFKVKVNAAAHGDYNAAAEQEVTISIEQKPAATVTTAPVAKTGLKYTGSAQELITAGTPSGGTMMYKVGSGSYSTDIPKEINANTYTIYYYVKGDENHSNSVEQHFDVKIEKADATVTSAPAAKTGLTYTGSAQELITAGTTSDGTMQYKLGTTGTYGAAIPQGTDADTYQVYYKVLGDANHNDYVAATPISVTICKADATVTSTPAAKTGLTYTGSAQELITAGATSDGTMQYKLVTSGTYGAAIPQGTDADTYQVYYKVKGDANHNDYEAATPISVTIGKADASDTMKKAAGSAKYGATGNVDLSSKIANGGTLGTVTKTDGQNILAGDPYMDGNNLKFTFKNEAGNVTKTAAINVPVNGSTNYEDYTIVVTVTVNAKPAPTISVPTAKAGLVFSGAAQNLISAGSTDGGTMQYKVGESGTYSTAIPQGIDAGTYQVFYRVVGDDEYADVPEDSISATISKKPVTVAPKNFTITKGSDIPTFELAYTGLVSGETLTPSDAATFTCFEADGTTSVSTTTAAGTYTITWTNESGTTFAGADNYEVNKTATGTLTIKNPSSGGGYIPTVQKPEITIIGSGKADLSADGRTATITAAAGHELVSVVLNGKEMGKVEKLTGLKTGDKATITFRAKTDGKAEMDKIIAQKASKLTLMARSKKTAKLNIKVVVKGDLKAITDAGYTVKYKFYRSTKKSAGYKAVLTKKAPTYVNTYGKKGTMYYYKARVMIYDKNGNFVAQTALKQCKYANRLWTK